MANEIKSLEAGNVALEFNSDENSFCTLSVRIGDEISVLGGDSFRLVAGRLLQALKGSRNWPKVPIYVSDNISNTNWLQYSWTQIFALSQGHTTLYANRDEFRLNTVFQGKDGTLVASFKLTNDDAARWIAILESWLQLSPTAENKKSATADESAVVRW